jgi:hypothetical protein
MCVVNATNACVSIAVTCDDAGGHSLGNCAVDRPQRAQQSSSGHLWLAGLFPFSTYLLSGKLARSVCPSAGVGCMCIDLALRYVIHASTVVIAMPPFFHVRLRFTGSY